MNKTHRWFGCFLTTLLLCLLLCSCGMNKEKAIEQMRQALLTSSTMESGKLSAQMTAQVELGADSIPMELSIEGEFQDQLQTMAMQIGGELLGQPIQTQTYQKDGFSYTLDEASGNYVKMPAATAGLDYRQLATSDRTRWWRSMWRRQSRHRICLYRGREGTAGAVYHAAGTVGHHAATDEQYDE